MKWLRRLFRRTNRHGLIYRADLDFAAERAAIDAAQAEVDARAQAQVNEAHAQAALDKANAAAAHFHFEIHGTGTLTAKQLLSAVGWDLNTDTRRPHKPPSGWRFPAPNPDPDYSSFLRWLGRGLTRADLKRLRLWR